ncbi:WD40-repeat-containing domain protein [Ilyonectria robusta]|uniref:WD40-repeat-containing domain protein n=1 Tax=Ilyonectria robusta TaxID=1079257 RepID=UPI001E8D487A|nr:WD40-repeat-containing domain protein [Ilyonectria robusta]KAH8734906.1 WD40-repeat-containing domain protein [Ilyonectria robusta]
MAGNKSTRTKDDQTKKRKRELAEADSRSKRQRAERKENKANGRKSTADLLNTLNGASSEKNGLSTALETTGDRELGIVPQFDNAEAGWRVSKPMGGRMLDIDPILTEDDQYLILAYNTSIQIYSAVDSLLVRRIPITVVESSAQKASASATIVATRLSKQNPHFIWVACSDGRVFHVDWTSSKTPESFKTQSGTAKALVVLTTKISKKTEEVLLIAESDKSNRIEVVAYEGKVQSTAEPKVVMAMKKPGNGLQLLELSEDGQVLVGAINDRLFMGVPSQEQPDALAALEYEFYSFDIPDLITALDVRVYTRPATSSKKARSEPAPVVDVIVGGARGSIYLYHDVLARSIALGKPGSDKEMIQAQKYHWHRKAVHALKWSRDGHYMISGGSENSLVLWQMDTSRKDFLPHLSGSVENIVVSASGSSYVIHLDDNSTMILSTAEMKPTAYIAGIQSAAVHASSPKDLLVQRTWTTPESVRRPIPAAIRPTDHSRLHVCVGNGAQATSSGNFSAPLLQTFDLETFRSVSRQALARTQPTDVNITNKGNPIDEPLITHMAFSADGEWLASVDTWEPSPRDVDNVLSDLKEQFIQERREVYLKFWEARQGDDQIALVSRINAPHATAHNEAVLDLASNPVSTCFATIGTDGLVRLWRPKTRSQNGVVVKGADGREVFTWSCSQVIAVGEGLPQEGTVDVPESTAKYEPQGSITFSEDGSTLFVAFGTVGTGAVYVIDAVSGEIVKTLEGQWKGQLRSVRALSPFIIVLSDELRVYDVVSDELRYGVVIPKTTGTNDLLQLAVDHTSGHFAVALPFSEGSTLGVFEPEESEPLLVRNTPQKIISLVSAPDTSGFIALDDAAQIWVVAEGSDASSLATVQPLEDLRLEDTDALDTDAGSGLIEEDEDMASDVEEDADEVADEEDVEMEDDDVHPRVVHQQHLADIFDAAPAFAAPPIEDMFYKVTGLLATKPLSASS